MAYRVRFYMEMNAREAMHLIELHSRLRGTRRIDGFVSECTR
jgi:hypothetical protein